MTKESCVGRTGREETINDGDKGERESSEDEEDVLIGEELLSVTDTVGDLSVSKADRYTCA